MEIDFDRPLDKFNTVGLITICLNCEGLMPGNSIHGFKLQWTFDDGWMAQPGSFYESDNLNCDCVTKKPYVCVLTCDGDHHWASHQEYDAFHHFMVDGGHELQ